MKLDKRRHESGLRRIEKAFQYFFDKGVFLPPQARTGRYVTFRTITGGWTEINYYFNYQGKDRRLDYTIEWNEPLPKITEIRQFVWDSLVKSTI